MGELAACFAIPPPSACLISPLLTLPVCSIPCVWVSPIHPPTLSPVALLSSLCSHSCSEPYLAIILSFLLPARKSLMLGSPGMLSGGGGAARAMSIIPGVAVSWGERMGLGPLKLG